MANATTKPSGAGLWALVLIAAVIALFALNAAPTPAAWRAPLFLWTLALLGLAVAAAGRLVNKRADGLIIDDRNRASLSKLQMLAWTVLVIGALISIAACRLRAGASDALGVYIPPELLEAMGIAATSFVATPVILNLKAAETPTADDLQQSQDAATAQGAVLQPRGKLHGRADPSQARLADLFRGDEVGNADSPDLGKIQQFAITVLLLVVYAATLFNLFASTTSFATPGCVGEAKCLFPSGLPGLSQQFILLMAISHASYLAYKAAPHTASADPDAQASPPQPSPAPAQAQAQAPDPSI